MEKEKVYCESCNGKFEYDENKRVGWYAPCPICGKSARIIKPAILDARRRNKYIIDVVPVRREFNPGD